MQLHLASAGKRNNRATHWCLILPHKTKTTLCTSIKNRPDICNGAFWKRAIAARAMHPWLGLLPPCR
jgi:hypothetical protein